MSLDDDKKLLRRVIVAMRRAINDADNPAELGYGEAIMAFENMLEYLESGLRTSLTDKQRRWVADYDEKVNGEVHYENAWSAGKVPRGEKFATPMPDVLKKPLPKRPPGRTT